MLDQEALRTLQSAEVKERFLASGVEPVGTTPEQFAAAMQSESARLGKVIKAGGIRGGSQFVPGTCAWHELRTEIISARRSRRA